jgi:methionyl-tRNA formyltransferase
MGLGVVFMGTPEFAVPALEAILTSSHQVVGVVTAPDKPQGRGLKLVPSAVKASAVNHGIKVLQPEKLKDPNFHEELKSLNADVFIVIAFRMLPEVVWSMPPQGTYNLHASLLPAYRGAAPINWAIINGETETGLTTFKLQHEIDTGNILFQDREEIKASDDAGSLYERLRYKGADLVLKTLNAIENHTAVEVPQDQAGTTEKIAPKIFRETCQINWSRTSSETINFIRGLSPYPAAWTILNDKTYKILKAEKSEKNTPGISGEISSDQKNILEVRVADGWVRILELQPEGKRKMKMDEFFRGNKI